VSKEQSDLDTAGALLWAAADRALKRYRDTGDLDEVALTTLEFAIKEWQKAYGALHPKPDRGS
jgi:hypothetical protein